MLTVWEMVYSELLWLWPISVTVLIGTVHWLYRSNRRVSKLVGGALFLGAGMVCQAGKGSVFLFLAFYLMAAVMTAWWVRLYVRSA
jgi:hypothetical protein